MRVIHFYEKVCYIENIHDVWHNMFRQPSVIQKSKFIFYLYIQTLPHDKIYELIQ